MGLPGEVLTGRSEFDNSTYVQLVPVWCETKLGMGLYQNSKSQGDLWLLTVEVMGAHTIERYNSLQINIDDKIYTFDSISKQTHMKTHPGYSDYRLHYYRSAYNTSSRNYLVTDEFLEKIANSKKMIVRVIFTDGGVEADCTCSLGQCVQRTFRGFYNKYIKKH
ncbi:hypothetical protein FAK_40710 [Desulfoferula mesophila]|uniref:Uncharacterized protein n=1 Tax=Desulfoferula mesophila TaxID=3058419 RepID=A0AAU9EZM8_9BACT|nr:hypothetical protein FAK_40710 [Desulfoferula mesophilus]